ncbi:unnamed protein product [Somion occarium]|uniref:FYVE-type domain-containing protein n=1 Tax=Somion occarium TaxID=3059160 RepID=A0ABP1CRK8_9APHY
MALASAIVARISSLSPTLHGSSVDSGDESASIISSQGTCSSSLSSSASYPKSLESSASTSSCPLAKPTVSGPLRPNEHLAVLVSKHHWKPDSQASHCDTFMCRKKFTIFERKHHCRKCGGVFCSDCSTKGTTLLDTSNLEFLHPPRNVPITDYESPNSSVVFARVCDDCYGQIHGRTRTPVIERSVTTHLTQEADSRASSPSRSPRSPSSPLRLSTRRVHTSPRIPSSPLRSSPPSSVLGGSHVPDSDLGELSAYPLRYSSAICKATGGGRWEPKPVNLVGYQPPGTKLPHEIELEREEEEKRRRRENPIFRDGDFQLRVPQEVQPRSLGGPITLSTF